MKKTLSLAAAILLTQVATLYAQPPVQVLPEGTVNGEITLPDNTVLNGPVKENIRKKGEVVLVQNDKKVKYKAGDINGVALGNNKYITHNYTFYEVVFAGNNLTLFRKASEPSGTQFNGADAFVVNSEGNIDDLFVKKNGETTFHALNKKNYAEVLKSLCKNCEIPAAAKFDESTISNAVQACDKSK
jgi:hypothetical protein